VLDHSNT